jgi:hypothetical protein
MTDERYKPHTWATWQEGDIVYEAYAPAKVGLVLEVIPSVKSADPWDSTLRCVNLKGEEYRVSAHRVSAHRVSDYRALMEDHRRKATKMQAVVDQFAVLA